MYVVTQSQWGEEGTVAAWPFSGGTVTERGLHGAELSHPPPSLWQGPSW